MLFQVLLHLIELVVFLQGQHSLHHRGYGQDLELSGNSDAPAIFALEMISLSIYGATLVLVSNLYRV